MYAYVPLFTPQMSGNVKIMGFGLANIEYVWKDDVFLS